MKNRLVRRSPPSPAEMLSSSATGSKFLTRRSPRFSSARPVELNAAAADVSDALALSLHVIGVGNGEEPVPLQIFVPTTLSAEKSMPKCRRRSPRFTTNKYSTASTRSQDVKALSFTVENGGGKLDGACRGIAVECSNSWGKRRHCEVTSEGEILKESRKVRKCLATCNGGLLDNLEEKCLRRSPRLNVKCKLLALPEPSIMEEKKIDLTLSEKTLRSRKIVCQRVLEKENKKSDNGNVKSELLAVPEPPPSVEKKNNDLTVSERTLRSRKIEFRLIQEEEIEVKTASIETSLENGINLGSCDSGQSSEKCLRSQKILASLVSRSSKAPLTQSKGCALSEKKQKKQKVRSCFVGEPVPEDEAQERWRWRYELKSQRHKRQSWILNANEEDEVHLNVEFHYLQAMVDGCIFNIGDYAKIKGNGTEQHIGKILEFFKTTEGEDYFRVKWFFRAEDTVIKEAAAFHDKKRLFFSTLMNDNLLDCIISNVNVIEISPMLGLQSYSIQPSEFYFDMEYSVEYSTFRTMPTARDTLLENCYIPSPNGIDNHGMSKIPFDFSRCEPQKDELALLDLFSGCGGMSTGLCLGAEYSGVNLVTRWAIDYHKSACESLKLNHPETQVRHTTAEDFLELLKEWEKLCKAYLSNDSERMLQYRSDGIEKSRSIATSKTDVKKAAGEYEVSGLVDICYGDPSESGKHGLKFKVRWEGYASSEDTWELIEDLRLCSGDL